MKLDVTLRTRLVILVIAAILPLFGLAVLGAFLTAQEAIRQTSKNLEFSASLVVANQDRVIQSARQMLTSIANVPVLAQGRQPDCQRYFKAMTEQVTLYANLGVIGADGYVACDTLGAGPSRFSGDRGYFTEALAKRDFVVGQYVVGRTSSKPIIAFGMPIFNANGATPSVAFASIYLTELSRAISSAPLPEGSHLIITDRHGIVLVTSDNPSLVGKPVMSPVLQAAFKTTASGIEQGDDERGLAQLYAYSRVVNSGETLFFVAVSTEMSQVVARSQHRLLLVFLALSLVAFIGSWLAWRVGERAIVVPVAKIVDAASRLQSGQLDVRIPIDRGSANSEMTLIANGFNRMASALAERERDLAIELEQTRQAERKLREAQRLGRIGNWEYDPGTRLVWWSDEVYALLGVEPGSLNGSSESFILMIHPDDRDAYTKARDDALRDNIELDIEYRVVSPDGVVRWLHQRGSPVFDSAGKVILRAGVVQEISERKRAEQLILRNIELMAHTGEMAKIGGWELLLDRQVLICSDEVYRIHEIEPAADTPVDVALDFYAPEARPIISAAVWAGIDEGKDWDLILPFITATGRRLQIRVQGKAIQKNGKTVRLVGALQDVTAQQEAQAHLRLLEMAVSRLNDIVLITEATSNGESDPRIIFVNDAFERQTGYSREEVLGRSPRFLHGPQTDARELERIGEAFRTWQPVRAELIHYTKSGQPVWVELDIVPISGPNGQYTHRVSVQRDVTDRKRTEQALLDSEQRYAALFAIAPVPMWVYDTQTIQFLNVNEAAIERYGYGREEFLSMSLFDIRPESERQALRDRLSSIDGPSNNSRQHIHRRKDGSVFPVQVMSKPIKYVGHDARFVLAIDITAQVAAEKEVQEHLFTLQRAADAAQAITWHQTLDATMAEVVDQARGVIGAHRAVVSLSAPDGSQTVHAVSLSEKYAQYRDQLHPIHSSDFDPSVCENNRPLRLTQAELEAHPRWSGYVAPAPDRPAMRGWLAVPLIGRNSKNIGLLQLSDRYQGDFSLQDEYVLIEMAQLAATAIENVQLFEQVHQLNTGLENKVLERTVALVRQEALFKTLTEQAPQVVWTADAKGRLTFVNRAWFNLVGGEMHNWAGNLWVDVIHPEDRPQVKQLWQKAVADCAPYVGIRRVRSKEGVYHTMAFRASPVLDAQGKVHFWVGIDADITEITAIEAALRLSNHELEAFSYSVSHDLRAPLNTIDGFSRLLSKHVPHDGGDKARHYLARIQAGVAQMGQLIEDLLSMAQVLRTPLRQEQVNLSQLTSRVLDDCQARDPSRQVRINVENNLQAFCDGRLIRVVLENLIGNAWKFTSQSESAEVTFGHAPDAAGQSIFFVRDNGAGFDMAYADKLFTPFQRLHAVSEFPGTGIGLATVSRVISRHGGRLWADAAPGRGATFFFTLPRMPGLA